MPQAINRRAKQNNLVLFRKTNQILNTYMKGEGSKFSRAAKKGRPTRFPKRINLSISEDIYLWLKPLRTSEVVSFILTNTAAVDLRRYQSMKKGDERRPGVKPKESVKTGVTLEAFKVWMSIPERFRSLMFREQFETYPLAVWARLGFVKFTGDQDS